MNDIKANKIIVEAITVVQLEGFVISDEVIEVARNCLISDSDINHVIKSLLKENFKQSYTILPQKNDGRKE